MKCGSVVDTTTDLRSHPARGAWIEIRFRGVRLAVKAVAPPHGVRGLKLFNVQNQMSVGIVAPRTGCVD